MGSKKLLTEKGDLKSRQLNDELLIVLIKLLCCKLQINCMNLHIAHWKYFLGIEEGYLWSVWEFIVNNFYVLNTLGKKK